MDTYSFEIKHIHLEVVEKGSLENYVDIINQQGNAFAGTLEEFEHYHDTDDGKLFEVKLDDSSLVGVIYVISKVNRSITTEVTLRDSEFYDNVLFEMENEDTEKIENSTCINFSGDTMLSNIGKGDTFRNIYDYSLNTGLMKFKYCLHRTSYDVETREMPCCLDDILEFDEKLFSNGNRRDFIETCAGRSDAIYVVKEENQVRGFGMLSKPVAGERLFGPTYAEDTLSVMDILYCLFDYLCFNPSDEEIIALIPDESLGHDVLPFRCFQRRSPVKLWRRKTCVEFDLVRDKVAAMGSLLFDIY